MRVLVTGGAGFIGSNLVDRLLAAGHRVTAFDNFSTGQRAFLADAKKNPRFKLVEGDLLDKPALTRAVTGHTSYSISRPTPTCDSAPTTPTATSSRTRSP